MVTVKSHNKIEIGLCGSQNTTYMHPIYKMNIIQVVSTSTYVNMLFNFLKKKKNSKAVILVKVTNVKEGGSLQLKYIELIN